MWRTDGRTDTRRQQRPRLRIASRDKNSNLYTRWLQNSETTTSFCPRPIGGIRRWCAFDDVWRLSVCRVHREYSWRPQLLKARRSGRRRRKACMGWSWAAAYGVRGRGHIVAASRTDCFSYSLSGLFFHRSLPVRPGPHWFRHIVGARFLQAECPSCDLTNSAEAAVLLPCALVFLKLDGIRDKVTSHNMWGAELREFKNCTGSPIFRKESRDQNRAHLG